MAENHFQSSRQSNAHSDDIIPLLLANNEISEDENGLLYPSIDHIEPESLASAFDIFNQLSGQLTQSYTMLETRVAELTAELNSLDKQRIKELKDKEQMANRLESLINFLPGGVVVLDQRGVIADINPAAESMLEKSLKGQLWREVITRCFFPKSDDGYEVSNHQGKRINIATRSLGEHGQIILLTDQTETRRLQEKVSRHERLTALGKMVSTLAHQVRTPLSSAMLYGGHLLNEPLSSHQQHLFTKKLVNRLHEMERQVSDMLLFVKPDLTLNDLCTVSDLHKQLTEAMEMPLSQYSMDCEWSIENDSCSLRCHKDALVGAILNLVNNSLQAIPVQKRSQKGSLSINIAIVEGNKLSITVADQGTGIDENKKSDVLELFYTTKSQGTGIGLSVVNSVAVSHGGSFRLYANRPNGTCAELELPIIIEQTDEITA